ncbi:hypothetical protein [Methylococcus capsulatus]|uniref:hypothetical protein n=1 Tax=Methylococcus capsulatus TaxID=414 RepID=UPI00059D0ED0|nr:hypothetical protein [Methylococcus capsulatus]
MADPDDDLSAGSLSQDEAEKYDIRLKLDKQKLKHRSLIFSAAGTCGALLVASFLALAITVMVKTACDPYFIIQWPVVAFGSVMLAAGTALLIGVARLIYRQDGDDKGTEMDPVPPAETIKQAVEIARLMIGKD